MTIKAMKLNSKNNHHVAENISENMNQGSNDYIIVTGAAGFIGSCMVQFLNAQDLRNIILVDDFGEESKRRNWEQKVLLILWSAIICLIGFICITRKSGLFFTSVREPILLNSTMLFMKS